MFLANDCAASLIPSLILGKTWTVPMPAPIRSTRRQGRQIARPTIAVTLDRTASPHFMHMALRRCTRAELFLCILAVQDADEWCQQMLDLPIAIHVSYHTKLSSHPSTVTQNHRCGTAYQDHRPGADEKP